MHLFVNNISGRRLIGGLTLTRPLAVTNQLVPPPVCLCTNPALIWNVRLIKTNKHSVKKQKHTRNKVLPHAPPLQREVGGASLISCHWSCRMMACEEAWPAQPVLSNEGYGAELVWVWVTGFLWGGLIFIVLIIILIVLRTKQELTERVHLYIVIELIGTAGGYCGGFLLQQFL